MKKIWLAIAILGATLLAACSFNATTEDKVTTVLEKIYDAEKIYRERQGELRELEQVEQDLFKVTMKLAREEIDLVAKNVGELTETLEERSVKIEEEAESMKKAKAFIADINKIDENHKAEVVKLEEALNHRYAMHEEFVESYQKLIVLQEELYSMLLEEEINATQLDEHVGQLNEQNKVVKTATESFNEATTTLNEMHDTFYETFKSE